VLSLIGIVIVVAGFLLRVNPLLVVTCAGLATGLASGLGLAEVIAAFGKAFTESRFIASCGSWCR
jgi:Predicted membrane protein